ncbi:conserved hypothetical protein [Methylocella tundrae]|jgi:hypothetical protein|uniref:Inner membrane protein YgaP-like transmembrane domain-containing protein n=1 Tax=Methylocella tundrae TaxID=227605 RepID=A0A8B6M3D2_METTU|nr:DUF2892 domain-containing protein [Methylocella tundrae]VTZ27178.1 conserved hypothetical protein [Methylocella tundrae]VTZ48770.1 conserved hypothetical protein [Methylocella tundrae]
MFYVKNVPATERVLRVLMGVAALAAAVAYFGSTPIGWGVGAMGMMAAVTGLVGFCPACALVGRKLDKRA